MSEQTMSAEVGSPRDRAIAYLEMQQHGRFFSGREKNVKTPIVPEKVRRPTPLVETAEAYEKVIDTFEKKGYEGLSQKLQDLRPAAYAGAQVFQWGTRLADMAITAAMFVPDSWLKAVTLKKAIPAAGTVAAVAGKTLFDTPLGAMRGHGWKSFAGEALVVGGMWRFRPIEWLGGKAVKLGGAIASSDVVAPVVNAILGGGERVQPEKPKPLPFSGTKPANA